MGLLVFDEVPLILVRRGADLALMQLDISRVEEKVGSQRGLPPEPLVADLTLELVLDPLVDNPDMTLEVTSRAVTLLT